jgi:hypothetical protein
MTEAVWKKWLAKVEAQYFASHKKVSPIKQRNEMMD